MSNLFKSIVANKFVRLLLSRAIKALVKKAVDELKEKAGKTPNTWDDALVSELEALIVEYNTVKKLSE